MIPVNFGFPTLVSNELRPLEPVSFPTIPGAAPPAPAPVDSVSSVAPWIPVAAPPPVFAPPVGVAPMLPINVSFPSFTAANDLAPLVDAARRNVQPVNVNGGFHSLQFSLADSDLASSGSGRVIEEHGFGIMFRKSGSNPAALLTLEIGGEIRHFAPGDWFLAKFERLQVRNSELGQAAGLANLLVFRRDDVLFRSDGSPVSLATTSGPLGPAEVATQAVNEPSGNKPTVNTTSGVSLAGVKGYRVIVSAESGQTLSGGGDVRMWLFNSTLARWSLSGISWTPEAGNRDWVSPDRAIEVPSGFLFPECKSVTVSGGTTVLPFIETWG